MGDEIRIWLRENAEAVIGVLLLPSALWFLYRAAFLILGPWPKRKRLNLPRTEDDRADS